MTVIYLTDYTTRCNGVIVQNIESVRVQILENISVVEKIIFCVKLLKTLLVNCEISQELQMNDKSFG